MATGDELHPLQEALLGRARPAVRLLHAGDDHGRRRPARAQPGPVRGRDPRRARRQPVPLHGLPQHRQGGPARRAAPAGRRGARSPRPSREVATPGADGDEPSENGKHVGRRMRRKEDPPLHHGASAATSTTSRCPPMLCAAFVRSPEAHARIASIDTSAARERAGVEAVYTGADLDLEAPLPARVGAAGRRGNGAGALAARQGRGQARRRPGRGRGRHGPATRSSTPPRTSSSTTTRCRSSSTPRRRWRTARRSCTTRFGTNKVHEWSLGGDVESALADADVIVERRFVNHRTAGAPIEPRGVIADYRAGELTVWSATQVPHFAAPVPRAPARHDRGPRARDRARRRRRLRLQAADLRRGDPARLRRRASSAGRSSGSRRGRRTWPRRTTAATRSHTSRSARSATARSTACTSRSSPTSAPT